MLDGIKSREKEILRLAYEDGLTGAAQPRDVQRAARAGGAHGASAPTQPLAVHAASTWTASRRSTTRSATRWATRRCARWACACARRCASPTSSRAWAATSSRCCSPPGTRSARPRWRDKILKALEAPLVIDGQSMDIAASIGIARFPQHGDDAAALMRAADVAMYVAKRSKAGYAIYDPGHDERRQEFLTLLGELRRAVETDELVLHYQPKMHARRQERVSAVEALVRWNHPVRGFIPPDGLHPVRRADRLHQRRSRAGCCARAIHQCGLWHRAGLQHARVGERLGARPAQRRRAGGGRGRGAALRRGAARRCSAWRSPRAASWTTRAARNRRCASCASSAWRPRSTTTAPATRRSPTSSSCR